jgi:hypothetical protein
MFWLSHNLSKSNLVPSLLALLATATKSAEFSCGAVDPNRAADLYHFYSYHIAIENCNNCLSGTVG